MSRKKEQPAVHFSLQLCFINRLKPFLFMVYEVEEITFADLSYHQKDYLEQIAFQR